MAVGAYNFILRNVKTVTSVIDVVLQLMALTTLPTTATVYFHLSFDIAFGPTVWFSSYTSFPFLVREILRNVRKRHGVDTCPFLLDK